MAYSLTNNTQKHNPGKNTQKMKPNGKAAHICNIMHNTEHNMKQFW